MYLLMIVIAFVFASYTFVAEEVKNIKQKSSNKKNKSCCNDEKQKNDSLYRDINNKLKQQHIPKF